MSRYPRKTIRKALGYCGSDTVLDHTKVDATLRDLAFYYTEESIAFQRLASEHPVDSDSHGAFSRISKRSAEKAKLLLNAAEW